jgi:hypothetical protein
VFSQPEGSPGCPWANILVFDPPRNRQDFDGLCEQPHDNWHGWIGHAKHAADGAGSRGRRDCWTQRRQCESAKTHLLQSVRSVFSKQRPAYRSECEQVVVSGANNVSLANPPGLYIQMPDFSGYTLPADPKLPPAAQPSDCWQIVRGAATVTDPVTGQPFNGNMMFHVTFQLPAAWIEAGVSFTVGDITINLNGVAQPIQFASQILNTFHIGLFARPLPATQAKPIACAS